MILVYRWASFNHEYPSSPPPSLLNVKRINDGGVLSRFYTSVVKLRDHTSVKRDLIRTRLLHHWTPRGLMTAGSSAALYAVWSQATACAELGAPLITLVYKASACSLLSGWRMRCPCLRSILKSQCRTIFPIQNHCRQDFSEQVIGPVVPKGLI